MTRSRRTLEAAVVAACVALAACWALAAADFSQAGWDFTQFYIAGKLPIYSLYDRSAARQFGAEHLAPQGIDYFPPYVRPAVFALPLRLLAMLDYWSAYWTWAGIALASYSVGIFLVRRYFQLPILLVPAFFAFFPAMWSMVTGQDAGGYLCMLFLGFILLERRRDTWAGFLFAACLYRFNMSALIPLILLLKRRYQALACFLIGGVLIATVSASLADPVAYLRLIFRIREESRNFGPGGLRGVLEAVGAPWVYPGLAATGVIALAFVIRRVSLISSFLITIVVTLLISPHSMWYDRTLLALPIAGLWPSGGWITRIVCVLLLACPFIWIFDNGISGRAIEIGLLAILLRVALNAPSNGAPPDMFENQASEQH